MENPYAPPQSDLVDPRPPLMSFLESLKLIAIATLLGSMLGALTNSYNAWMNLEYFSGALRFIDDMTWRKAVAWGAFEGALYGSGNGLLFLILIRFFCRNRARMEIVSRYFYLIAFGVLAIWSAAHGYTFLHFGASYRHWISNHWNSVHNSIVWATKGSAICTLAAAMTYTLRHRDR